MRTAKVLTFGFKLSGRLFCHKTGSWPKERISFPHGIGEEVKRPTGNSRSSPAIVEVRSELRFFEERVTPEGLPLRESTLLH